MKLTTKSILTPEEAARRKVLEAIIRPKIAVGLECALALKEFSDRRLYRNTHSTFKDYVQETYGVEVRTAYQLIEHAEMVKSLPSECATVAQTMTPRATRALKGVPSDKRAEVIEVATVKAGGKPTERAVKEAAAEVCPKPNTTIAPACDEDENLIQNCIEIIRAEQKASICLLQRRLRLGYARAVRIMDELERRGIVGPSNGAEPRDVLIDPEPVPEAIRNDRAMREAFGGTVPPVPTDDPIKEALSRHAEESFHKFKVIVSGAVSEIPKNVDSFVFSEWLHGQANLISNRRDQQKNNGAYTR